MVEPSCSMFDLYGINNEAMKGREIIQEFAHDNMKSWELSSERYSTIPSVAKKPTDQSRV